MALVEPGAYTFKPQDRVYQVFAPDHSGTVTEVTTKGFRVTWDSPPRLKGAKRVLGRQRLWYSWGQAMQFVKGNYKEEKKGNDRRTVQVRRSAPGLFREPSGMADNATVPTDDKGKARGRTGKGQSGTQSQSGTKARAKPGSTKGNGRKVV